MKLSMESLLSTLSDQEGWVDAQTLAALYHVTPRTVRNYVRKANQGDDKLIESSHDGYRLMPAAKEPIARTGSAKPTSPRDRRTEKLLRLLLANAQPQSMYDLADTLHVSDSAFQALVRHTNREIEPFGLVIAHRRDKVTLDGNETGKRRLINRMIVGGGNMDLVALTNRTVLENGYDTAQLTSVVKRALKAHGLTCDDYGLNGIVMHLAIMLSRIEKSQGMPATEAQSSDESPEAAASRDICQAVEKELGIPVGVADQKYFSLVVEANTRRVSTKAILGTQLAQGVSERDIQIARKASERVANTYCLEPFSDEFIMRVAAHIHALLGRAANDTFVYNPLTAEVRTEYPLIHDMAVVMADAVAREAKVHLPEDEISFFTFHIGGYLQNHAAEQEQVTCEVLYLDYQGLQDAMLRKLSGAYGTTLKVVAAESVSSYRPGVHTPDILMTPVHVDAPDKTRQVIVGPLFDTNDQARLRKAFDEIVAARRNRQISSAVHQFLRPDLFRIDFYPGDRDEMIAAIVSDCMDKGLVGNDFYDKVLEREALSPTVFDNLVAIPHTIEPAAHEPFLYLVINSHPIAWGNQTANIVLLLGTTSSDRESFTNLYSDFLMVLSEPANAAKLMQSTSYDDFVKRLGPLIQDHRSAC